MSLEVEDEMDMMGKESTSLVTGSKHVDDPEAPDMSEAFSIGVVHRKHGGNKYENVFTIDEDDLGNDPNVLMVPLSYKRRKCVHRWILCIGVLFGLVTLSIGVIYVLNVNGIEIPEQYNPFTIGQVKHVPEDIADQCSSIALKTTEGWHKCNRICSVAKCCMKPINSNGSCLHQYETQCSKYFHYCKVIFDSDGVPPEGLSTKDESSPNGHTSDQGSGSSTDDNEPSIGQHSVNLTPGNPNLEMSGKSWAITLDNITKACEQDTTPPYHLQDGAKCHYYCQDLKCCFLENGDPDACYTKYEDYCDQFYMCGVMYNGNSDEKDESLTSAIDPSLQELCSNQYIIQNGPSDCENKCSERDCCFISEKEEGSCFLKNPSWCEEYIPCTKTDRYSGKGKVSLDNLSLEDVCDEMYRDENGDGDCEDKCSTHDCCFLPMTNKNSCFVKNKDDCEKYIPCTKIDKYNGKGKSGAGNNSGNNNNNKGGGNNNKSGNNNNGGNNNKSANNSQNGNQKEVDNIVSLVKQACYISPVKASTTDYAKCANLCQSRMCCFQSDDNLSCYKDKTDWCEEFSACYKLNIDDLIGKSKSPAITPVNDETELKVEEACSESSLETLQGMTSCGKLCVDKKCCFDDGNKDKCDSCEDYKSCKTFFTQTSKSKLELETLCTRDKISDNYNTCSHICSQRSCCFNWGQEGNCYNNNENWCDEFHHCYNLNWVDVSKEETSALISEACSKMNVMTDEGRERCLSLCEDHTCCFSQTDDNCYKQETEFCVGYESCRNLYISPKYMTEEFCAKDKISSTLGYSVCSVLCTGRSCCFQEKGSDKYCYDEFQSWCDEFNSCYNIDSITSVVNSYNSDTEGYIVNHVCRPDKLKTDDGVKDCQDICSERYCCFESGRNNCYDDSTQWCDEFKACKNLDSLLSGTSSSNQEQQKVDQPQQDVDDLCSSANLSTSDGLQECKKACEVFACCFAKDEGLNCFDDQSDSCNEYKACEKLMYNDYDDENDDDLPVHDDMADEYDDDEVTDPDVLKVNTYCAKAVISDDDNYGTCKNLCQQRDCCFHWGKENCYEEKEDWCDDFRFCYNLDWADEQENKDSQGDLLLVVEEACSKLNILTVAGGERCNEMCEDRECCYDPDLTKNCWQSKPDFCEGYEACANLNIKDEDVVKEFCSQQKISTGLGYAVCEVLCTTRPCCFAEGKDNCAKQFPKWCDSMEICNQSLDMSAIMKSYDRNTDANIVQKACSKDQLSSEGKAGVKDCKELCSERGCCFLPGRDNCSSKYKDWCDEFSACNNLDSIELVYDEDDAYDDQDEDDDNDDDDDDDDDPEVQAVQKVCAKSAINVGDNYNQCKDLCIARDYYFH